MTNITELYRNDKLIGFRIEGHAGYSIPGRDIVCAAVSAITINAINSAYRLSGAEVELSEHDGYTQYIIFEPDTVSAILLKSAKIGYKSIAERYPDNVTITERR